MNDRYFAAAPPEEIAQELQKKVDAYYTFITASNLADLWRRSYRAYYGMRQSTGFGSGWGMFDIGSLMPSGEQGEICRVKVNHFSNLITHQMSLTCGQRPAVECRASNGDAKSLSAAKLGDGIVEYYFREKKIERVYYGTVECGLVVGEGYAVYDWDTQAGDQVGVGPEGEDLRQGDLTATVYTPFNVVKDITKTSDSKQHWYILKGQENRYDLIAKWAKSDPDLAYKIQCAKSDFSVTSGKNGADPSRIIATTNVGQVESDDVPVFQFRHAKTAALPQGRLVIFLSGDIKLYDGPLPFRDPMVYRFAPKNIIGSPFGWTNAFDILGLQELTDKLHTIQASNVMGGGMQRYWSPPNNGLNVTKLGELGSLVESMVKPEILEMLRTPAEVYEYTGVVERLMETLSGVSAINRGQLPSNDLSGTAMAFAASQAITFASGAEQSATELVENLGTGCVRLLQDFGNRPRVAMITGKQNRAITRTFSGEDLAPIGAVVCERTNALSKTIAGKLTIADNLLKSGLIKSVEEYITLVETGNMEPMTRAELSQNILIQQENEWLLEGKLPTALRFDMHAQHMREHKTVLDSPEAREDPVLLANTDAHIRQHEQLAMQMQMEDPAYLAATGQPPLPFPQQMQAPGLAPGQAPNGPPPGAGMQGALNPATPIEEKAASVRPPATPNMPRGTDPQTQNSFDKLQQLQGAS